jgi:hypothetical protein
MIWRSKSSTLCILCLHDQPKTVIMTRERSLKRATLLVQGLRVSFDIPAW